MEARERLRKWRGERSQREAAQLIGCAQSMVGSLEAGTKRPKIDLAMKIERATKGAVRLKHWQTPDMSPEHGVPR